MGNLRPTITVVTGIIMGGDDMLTPVDENGNSVVGKQFARIELLHDGQYRAVWPGHGLTNDEAMAHAVKRMLDDPLTAEYVKES